MSALTNAVLALHPGIVGGAARPATRIILRGKVTRTSDPMYRADGSAIVKLMDVSKLPTTVVRWLALGRRITSITEAP